VRFSYQVPYPSNRTTVRLSSDYSVGRVMLVAAPSVQISSPGFNAAGTEQGFSLYTRDSVPAGLPFDVSVSGTAPPPSAAQLGQDQDQGQGQGNAQDPSVNSRATVSVQALPGRLDTIRWIVIGGFAALFALGVLIVWRQPNFAPGAAAGAGDMPVPSASAAGPRKRKSPPGAAPPSAAHLSSAASAGKFAAASSVKAAPAATSAAVASVDVPAIDREVQTGLEGLKDKLFRLELRRQAGTISEEDYARERARTEQILRELVQG